MRVGRHIEIQGIVQGVGFRPWVYNLARSEGLSGRVSNDAAGVVIDAFAASEGALDAFVQRLHAELPPAARIDALSMADLGAVADSPSTFEIAPSSAAGAVRPSIPADLATCEACLREIQNPRDRRYRYPFTSCTRCGPRFTIALGVPYDRATTTMAPFRMCPECQREYDDPQNRRFHAQPNACPKCGPRLRLLDFDGCSIDDGELHAISRAAALLRSGAIVAVKGLGGFHLACDATDAHAVAELRRRKRRDDKPFAIMVRDRLTAERLAIVGPAERKLLESPARPIVLLRRRPSEVVQEIAPGSDRIGIMLPYTPLHHVLLGDVDRPLVMTSGNLSDEPIATDNVEALARLGAIADAFLVHDRDIASRADDSVAFVALGKPVLARRSRGWVPNRVPLKKPLERPVLACGAHLKNTFCLGERDGAYFGPHIGDLDNLVAFEGYERAIERMERFLQTKPEIVAHDLHPDYLSTRYALGRRGVVHVAVQHHHAHVASAIVEHGIEGRVVGVAFDGTGFGTDGTSWGGEVMIADCAGFERVASLRPIRLPGGDRAIRHVWRTALALLDDAFDGDPPLGLLPLFEHVSAKEVAIVRRMLATGTHSPRASGAGRYFDAIGAIALERTAARFEGQVAIALEQAAGDARALPYPYAIDEADPVKRIDLRPTVRAIVSEHAAGSVVAARFHETLVAATADVVRALDRTLPVVLTGGCFQNVRLTESLVAALGFERRVFVHGEVPPGDGGLALGQLAVADAVASGGSSCA